MMQLENSSNAGEPGADDSLKPDESAEDENSQKSDDDALKALMATEPKK
jgi:hypothetical protein